MYFSTKGKTLLKLKRKGFNVPNLLIFTQEQFKKNKFEILKKIKKSFKKKIAIRSSALNEDSNKKSLAGKYLSVLDIDSQNFEEIEKNILKVFSTYSKNLQNQIIIQEMVRDVFISGVCTTVDLHNYLPVINVNYDKGSNTDVVTSGFKNSFTITIFDKKFKKGKNKYFDNLIILIRKLKKIFKPNQLDIEFAIDKFAKVHLLQVRKLIIPKNKNLVSEKFYYSNLLKLEKKIKKLQEKNYDLLGNYNFFGVMPDWNPAEIIGTKPRPLALSLYKELITDHIWSKNRHEYGFKNLESHHLMTSFFGTPYIDVRVDFNSWIPRELDIGISTKLINFYLKKFNRNKNLHDKVEFEILFTCFTAKTIKRLENDLSNKFTRLEIKKIKNSLININKIAFKASKRDSNKIEILKEKQRELINSKMYSLNKIYYLIEDCKKFGTLPFAGLARCGFIAVDILNSFVETNILTIEEKNKYLNSIRNIATKINEDFVKLNKKKFSEINGHLRPNTYDITSLNYSEGYNFYFDKKNKNIKEKRIKFNFSSKQKEKINIFINKNGFEISFLELNNFIKNSIYLREYAKFVFSKSIDLVFQNLIEFGKNYNISREDLSYLDINTILNFHYKLDVIETIKDIKDEIKKNKSIFKRNSIIHLPETITSIEDLFQYEKSSNNGNFITQKKINGEIFFYKNLKEIKDINNKIVLIESADPGYDFIFTKKIKGLITKYGGQNSHMSIRSAELSLPASIGVGENKFNEILKKRNITLDCLNKKIY